MLMGKLRQREYPVALLWRLWGSDPPNPTVIGNTLPGGKLWNSRALVLLKETIQSRDQQVTATKGLYLEKRKECSSRDRGVGCPRGGQPPARFCTVSFMGVTGLPPSHPVILPPPSGSAWVPPFSLFVQVHVGHLSHLPK